MTGQDPAMERARKRARELRDYYKHLLTYVLVCTLLVVIDLADSSDGGETFLGLEWAYWPIFGWGIAIIIHTISVSTPLGSWEERKAAELYEKERRRELEHR